MDFVVDTMIEPGLRYTEEAVQIVRSSPVRYCYLWRTDEPEPVCELEIHSFRQRFGAASVPAEGIGGVETRPQFRRQGYMSKLLVQAMIGMARRVDVAFVSDGIEGVYEKFGFVTSLAEGHLVVPVRYVEQMAANDVSLAKGEVCSASPDDLPAIIRLYNTAHTHRPWTHERHAGWNRLVLQETWRPGSEALVLEANGAVVGYVILQGQSFGHNAPSVIVDELAAQDAVVARRLLVEIASRCWQMRLSEFWVREPLDSLVGQVARRAGCTYEQTFPPSGGMMAAVLNRSSLLETLEPELRRRYKRCDYDEQNDMHDTAFAALQRGEFIVDNLVLIRLLLGYWSADEARTHGLSIPTPYKQICETWFPGGGASCLPLPYAHKLDRY
jgi:hypothetical protein